MLQEAVDASTSSMPPPMRLSAGVAISTALRASHRGALGIGIVNFDLLERRPSISTSSTCLSRPFSHFWAAWGLDFEVLISTCNTVLSGDVWRLW